jgi:hypothetical protein
MHRRFKELGAGVQELAACYIFIHSEFLMLIHPLLLRVHGAPT